ncbi:Calnexin [Gryllus bimaculatus]|nr:Calnexin [Gryllus bimaculatus]
MVRLTIFAILLLSLVSVCLSEDDSDEAVVTEEIDDVVPDEEIVYVSPTPSGNTYLAEHFDDEGRFKQKWIVSEAKKDDMDEEISKYEGMWAIEPPQQDGLKGDLGLVLKSKAKHSAISARLDRPFVFADKPFIVQYEVAFQEGQDCGGAYLKLLSQSKQSSDLRKFNDKTPYTIMFGPDKCGTDVKLHFIFRHKNPNNGTMSEKHCKKPKDRVEEPYKDKRPHLYTLHLRPDNSFTVFLDQKIINEGNLLEDFTPPVNPPAEIEDPSDKKPEDWDEREKIADPEAKKPDDWDEDAPPMIPDESAVKPDGWLEDEPEMIPDPNAEKPDDWDTDMDGEWEAPLISNPACEGAPGCGPWKRPMINNPAHKGKWRPPLIDNPNYKGKWKPRRIPNPDFYEDLQPFKMTRDCNYGQVSNMIFVLTILL